MDELDETLKDFRLGLKLRVELGKLSIWPFRQMELL